MDHARRLAIARHGSAQLDAILDAIERSWVELLPAAATWDAPRRQQAREAARTALLGILDTVVQGDLDDATWRRTRRAVYGGGRTSHDEAAELVRSVRVVGVELLADTLERGVGLSQDERWELQRQAAIYVEDLLGDRPEISSEAVDALLGELSESGPDLR